MRRYRGFRLKTGKALKHWIGRQISRKRPLTMEAIHASGITEKTLRRHGYVLHPDILIMKVICE